MDWAVRPVGPNRPAEGQIIHRTGGIDFVPFALRSEADWMISTAQNILTFSRKRNKKRSEDSRSDGDHGIAGDVYVQDADPREGRTWGRRPARDTRGCWRMLGVSLCERCDISYEIDCRSSWFL